MEHTIKAKTKKPSALARLFGGKNKPAREPPPHQILRRGEHSIQSEQIHPSVLDIVSKLRQGGFEAQVVGGAVRDMLMGRTPKDFDVVTSAKPEQVKALFQRARIIGRRFRLVLLHFKGITVEVSTFRAPPKREGEARMIMRDNRFGTPREDAFRRDFTINALAFDPETFAVTDWVGGLEDLEGRVIRTITPPEVSFAEDPVRMLRAVRFQVRLGFKLDPPLESAIRQMTGHLAPVVRHRLAEETQRFLTGGQAVEAFARFRDLGLLGPLLSLSGYKGFFPPKSAADPYPVLLPYLEDLDRWAAKGRETLSPTVALLGLLITLGKREFRNYITANPQPVEERKEVVAGFRSSIPAMMGEWGLLKGQVMPALHILGAAHALIREQNKGGRPETRVMGGVREAWLLLTVLRRVLGLSEGFVKKGIALLPDLPVLPILDHPRPKTRGGILDPLQPRQAKNKPPSDGVKKRRKRRRRRPRGRGGAGGPA